jgi:LmbE family N-acetylglucosaminyl deacetylase
MNILAVGANPDDVELLCSGTLAIYSNRGDNIHICYVSNGDKGGNGIAPEKMVRIRKKEAHNAAQILNARTYPLNVPDGEALNSLELRRKLAGVIRKTKADVIITHYHKDYMSDHNSTSILVADAAFWAMVAGFKSIPGINEVMAKPPVIYNMDTLGGIDFLPEEYVDISNVIDTKVKILSQHKSQIIYMKERDNLDFIDYMITVAKFRGYQCGVKYAEAFVKVRRYPFLTSKRLLP